MKKLIPILLAVFALVSCEKDPDMDKLDNEYLVFTSHDTSTKFNDFSTYYFHGYYNDGPWWGYYPGYWYPGYWGGNWGGGWYYPYPITYSYSTGSLLADMINLKNAPEGQKEKLTVVWNAYISGLLGGSGSLNVNRTTTAINQAFTQSPYLKK